VLSTDALELEYAHGEFHRLLAERQILDVFSGSGLMDGVTDFPTVGTNAEPMPGCHRNAIALQIAFLLARNYFIIGQV
jgi:hypothetical protein